jgi:hypothetical protein
MKHQLGDTINRPSHDRTKNHHVPSARYIHVAYVAQGSKSGNLCSEAQALASIPIVSKLHHCFRVGPVTVGYQEQRLTRLFHVKEHIWKIWIELDVPVQRKSV